MRVRNIIITAIIVAIVIMVASSVFEFVLENIFAEANSVTDIIGTW